MHQTLPILLEDILLRISGPNASVLGFILILILVVSPFLFVSLQSTDNFSWYAGMLFQNLGLGLVWNKSQDHSSDSSSDSKKLKKKKPRTRAEQLAKANGQGWCI